MRTSRLYIVVCALVLGGLTLPPVTAHAADCNADGIPDEREAPVVSEIIGSAGDGVATAHAQSLATSKSAAAAVEAQSLQHPQQGNVVEQGVYTQLENSRDGTVYVIIVLRPVDRMTGRQASAQPDVVATIQDRVLSRMAPQELNVAHRFQMSPIVTGRVSAAGLAKLEGDPDVLIVGLDAKGKAVLDQSVPFINADSVHALGYTGAGVTVAVLDTGIDTDHPDLADNVATGAWHILDQGATQGPGAEDDHGHGTAVSGIITSSGALAPLGVSPDADILPIKVIQSDGSGWLSDWAAGVDYVTANAGNYANLCAINISLGSFSLFSECPCDNTDAFNQALQASILAAKNVGIVTFVSSGNDASCTSMSSPACVSAAVAVAAVYDSTGGSVMWSACTDPSHMPDQITCFSNQSACNALAAPGAFVTTSGLGGGTVSFNGTSAAAPFASAVAALMCHGCEVTGTPLTPDQIAQTLLATGVSPTNACGTSPNPVRIDALAAVEAICFLDCNNNGVPDMQDVDPADPDGNGQVSNDCNANGIPDECEPDCNSNGIPDECEGGPAQLFVDAAATGAGNGTNWTDAFVNLQDALSFAACSAGAVAEIWVANGTYMPDGTVLNGTGAVVQTGSGDRAATFQLVDGVSIFGGFEGLDSLSIPGGETDLAQRPPDPDPMTINPLTDSILSGDLAGIDPPIPPCPSCIAGPIINPSNGHIHYLLPNAIWTDSEAQAVALGGQLATINDAVENQWVLDTFGAIGGVNRSLWIGLTDQTQESVFVWVSGQPVTYTNWRAGEPNNAGAGENWAQIQPPADTCGPGQWNDLGNTLTYTGCSGTWPNHGVVEIESFTDNSFHVVTGSGSAATAVLDGFAITLGNGNGGAFPDNHAGGALIRSGSPTIRKCGFVGNSAVSGGAILIEGAGANPRIENCRFKLNSASNNNGAINTSTLASPTILNCVFEQNTSSTVDGGGAIGVANATADFEGCDFINNDALANDGGAGLVNVGSTSSFTNCRFLGNSAAVNGGGLKIADGANVLLTGCTFINNTASGPVLQGGGAISLLTSTAMVTNSEFLGNASVNGDGGAIQLENTSDLVLINCVLTGNASGQHGGAINLTGAGSPASTAAVTNCTFAENLGGNGAGGAMHLGAGTIAINNSILWLNQPQQIYLSLGLGSNGALVDHSDVGGGLASTGGCTSCAIDLGGNITSDPLFVGGPLPSNWTLGAVLELSTHQTTFTDNTATYVPNEHVGKFLNPNTSQFLQSLIVGNTATTITVWGDFAPQGTMGAQYKINDYRLGSGSPAIDAADNTTPGLVGITTDLDGSPRFVDDLATPDTGNGTPPIVDMGAYELQPDCNTNGIPDATDIANMTSPDCNANGIPDECDIDCGGLIISEIMDGTLAGETPKYVEITNTAAEDFVFLEGGLIIQSNFSTSRAIGVDLTGVIIRAGESFVIVSSAQGGDSQFVTVFGFAADLVTPFGFGNGNDRYMITTTADSAIIVDSYGEDGVSGFGTPWEYTDSFAFRLPAFNAGVGVNFNAAQWSIAPPGSLVGVGAAGILAAGTPGVHDSGPVCASADCNSNGIPDDCELSGNDCNTDGIPDDCQLAGNDCNANGIPDECDTLGDFNDDGIFSTDDLAGFVDNLLLPIGTCLGDFDGDGLINGQDIQSAIDCLINGICP